MNDEMTKLKKRVSEALMDDQADIQELLELLMKAGRKAARIHHTQKRRQQELDGADQLRLF